MPPSPAMRILSRRELRVESHKRGRSLESRILYQDKDDDLALFNEVRSKERENFLLQSNDDFDDIFSSKLRYFSDYKLGISVPARGESSELLNSEGDKNDYDWLITPPETPLFNSLDDDAPSIGVAPRGRSRSQPVAIPQSYTMEKMYRNSRGSASPQRISPSPRSGNSPLQSRSRPLSATHSSPPPTLRNPSPSRRLSPPQNKPTPALRSSSPTPRRMSTGSVSVSATVPSMARGASPSKTSRGESASPKIRAWQSNIPGFSLEAPPNLRTSLADRPASYVRGSSPASRNSSRSGRQSMSPTASRSVSSSHSHDRDPFSAHSKGSVASSGDDDNESPQSLHVSSSNRTAPRSIGSPSNNRALGFSKKPSKPLSSSAPKRSFDLALRQMDKKGPQNMFRPLLSSVPSSTFTSAHHRSLISRNSSITTSSNASSDQGTSGAHDTEEIEQNQEDVTSNNAKGQNPTVRDEIFTMNEVDPFPEESPGFRPGEVDEHSMSQLGFSERSGQSDTATTVTDAILLDKSHDFSNADGLPDMLICSRCGRRFHSDEEIMEKEFPLCIDCKHLGANTTTEHKSLEVSGHSTLIPSPLLGASSGKVGMDSIDKSTNESQDLHVEPRQNPEAPLVEVAVQTFPTDQVIFQQLYDYSGHQQSQHTGDQLNSKSGNSEGAGISLLLKASSGGPGGKGPLVQSRSFTASNICYDDFSYVRDTSLRSSIGHSSTSVSSSADLGYSRKMETTNHKRSISALSGASSHATPGQNTAPSCLEDGFVVVAEKFASESVEIGSSCIDDVLKSTAELQNHVMVDGQSGDSEEPIISQSDCSTKNSSNSKSPAQGEHDMPSSCEVEVAEVNNPSSLNTKSEMEMENTDTVSADSFSDVDYTNELLEPLDSVAQNDVMIAKFDAFDTSDPTRGPLEESSVMLEEHEERKPRSLTLEEATDTILFCSSIVHNLAYEAVNLAINKETLPLEALHPAVAFVSKPNSMKPDFRTRPAKRSSKTQKTRRKRLEMDPKPPSADFEGGDKSSPQIVKSPSKGDSMKPPKLESKCNCSIM